ncbi:MAG: hypothetical protein AB7E52_09115, partial [Bdellovibrionales bacterium]
MNRATCLRTISPDSPFHFDTSSLATPDLKDTRVFWGRNRSTGLLPANGLTSLHIFSKSFVKIHAWDQPAVCINVPERVYPFEVYAQKNRIVFREKPNRLESTIRIYVPKRIDFLHLILRDGAICTSTGMAHVTAITTTGQSKAFLNTEHLFAQCLDESTLHATMVPKTFNFSNERRPGKVLALCAGDSMKLSGHYETAKIAFIGNSRLRHPAFADRMKILLFKQKTSGAFC